MIDRRHPDDTAARHLSQRVVIKIDAVFDRVGARAHGVLDAGRAVGVDRHLLLLSVRSVHDRFHLIETERLGRVDVIEAADRAVDLDAVDTGLDVIVYVLPQRLEVDRRARPRREAGSRDEHARSGHRAQVDQIAHREIHVVRRAEIAHGRDAGVERALRVVLRQVDGDRGKTPRSAARLRARLAIPVVRHVRVEIDEAGDAGVAPKVDDLRARRHRGVAAADAGDAVVLDDDEGVGDDAGAVPEVSEADRFCLCARR